MINISTPQLLSPWLGIVIVLVILGGLITGLHFLRLLYSPPPELTRKLLHIGMGLVTLSFPWLFNTVWPVLLLACISALGLMALKFYKPLQRHLGGVIDGIERKSMGEIYFPLAVGLLFLFSEGNALLFCIPMLILTLADAVAALIGVRYGRLHYTTGEGEKSAEGSTAFFTVAFLSTHIPLLLFTTTGRAQTLLIALILGLLVMLVEAIALAGSDNLFIPMGGFLLLKTFLAMDVTALSIRLVVTVALVCFALCWGRRTTLNGSALIGAALVGYLTWTLGDWRWLLAALIVFISYSQFLPSTGRVHCINSVINVASAGLFWLFLAGFLERPEFLYPYTVAFAANLAIIGVAGLPTEDYTHKQAFRQLGSYILKVWLLFVPFIVLQGSRETAVWYALTAMLGVALAAIAFYITQPTLRRYQTNLPNWLCRTSFATAGSALGLIPLYAG